jgi:hypothetical protein
VGVGGAGGGEAVGIREADRVGAAKACGGDADCLRRLMDGDAEGGDRFTGGQQLLSVGGGCDQHLGQVEDADQPGRLLSPPAAEECPGAAVVSVVAVEGPDLLGADRKLSRLPRWGPGSLAWPGFGVT